MPRVAVVDGASGPVDVVRLVCLLPAYQRRAIVQSEVLTKLDAASRARIRQALPPLAGAAFDMLLRHLEVWE